MTQLLLRQAHQLVQLRRYPSKIVSYGPAYCKMTKLKHWLKSIHTMLKIPIPSGTYKIKSDVKTVAVKAMLVVTKDLDEDLVYEMTKAIYENTDQITHAKGKFITAETALEGLGDMEVHPGAAKYFKEKGVSK